MKILLIIIVCVLLLLGAAGVFAYHKSRLPADKHDLVGAINQQVKALFKNQQGHGVVVGVIKDGRSEILTYGVAEKGSSDKPTAQSVFQIGSITKVFTASLLHIFIEQDRVKADDTIKDVLGDSYPLSDRVAGITLEQLATHTSGLPRIPKSLMQQAEALAGDQTTLLKDPYSYLTPEDMFAYLSTAEDTKSSGKFAYSNYGMGLLGHLLERVSGESFEYLLQTHIFSPLNMDSAGTVVSPSVKRNLAQGYDAKGAKAGVWQFAVVPGAGAVHSNTEDMLKFIQASLDAGSDANKRFEQMRIPRFGGTTGLGWMQAGFFEKILGVADYHWHNGMVGGYASYIAINSDNRSGVIILTSRAIDATMMGIVITRHVKTQSWSD